MFDLAHFTLRDMTVPGSALRRSGEGAHSMEEVAGRVVRSLYEDLVDPSTGGPACGRVRFFKTHDYGELRTPLTSVRGALDLAERHTAGGTEKPR